VLQRGLAQSVVWGLARVAQSEHPGRLVLVDIDEDASAVHGLDQALLCGEPQLALREGKVYCPRIARVAPVVAVGSVVLGGGTVLVTGGTGVLGGLVARRLVVEHGVRHLLLVSRSGGGAEGVGRLRGELEGLGASVAVEACDVGDRAQLEVLLAGIPGAYPLCGVVHAAGVLDDGVIDSLSSERLERVLAAKADGAWYLHELTQHLDLQMFVMFSSAAGTLGSPGQGNYAAANAFLDQLAAYRQAQGLRAHSLAWGWWEQPSGMTGHLRAGDLVRMRRIGLRALPTEQGLELLDNALARSEALLLPLALDLPTLRAQARASQLPPLLNNLIRTPPRRASEVGSLAARLAGMSESERERLLAGMVRKEAAAILGHATPEAVDEQRAFKELGFDSLAAVELRNRLSSATGLQLPATLIFDHPTPTAVTNQLLKMLDQTGRTTALSLNAELERLDQMLQAHPVGRRERQQVAARLKGLLARLDDHDQLADRAAVAQKVLAASADEVVEFINSTLNSP
jgi:NAD(P)-dependent dehydrogenase (short-subunit alcohol dehydrogenase family)/acyl carrier protein